VRVLITGGAGLLGSALLRAAPAGVEVHATRRTAPVQGAPAHAVELSDAAAVERVLRALRPDLVLHTAYSAAHGERDIVAATASVVAACGATGAALVHLSSDALLDGASSPYGEDAEPAPVHAYGRFKARAERQVRARLPAAAVVRTSLLLRVDPPDPNSAWVLEALGRGEPARLFVDEIRAPAAADDVAAQLWEVAALEASARSGVWHLAGPEALSRYALGVLLALRHGLDPAGIVPTRSADAAEPRPRDLRLLTRRADAALRTRTRGASEILARG
jgi:dTDP-4-dehydrorhamnose reductase